MSPAEEYLRGLVRMWQEAFYPETLGAVPRAAKAAFYRELSLVRQACTWPAKFVREKGWSLSRRHYRAVQAEIIAGVQGHGVPPAELHCRGRYLLVCVQRHWARNWDRHYEEAKGQGRAQGAKRVGGLVEGALRQAGRAAAGRADDETLDVLAEASRLLAGRGGNGRRKGVA